MRPRLTLVRTLHSIKRSFSTAETHFDLIVIGGGSGGVSTARRAASHGARVALLDEGTDIGGSNTGLGGTCVKAGCIPKKVYKFATEYGAALHEASHFGWGSNASDPPFHLQQLRQSKDALVNRLDGIYDRLLNTSHVQVFRNTQGRLVGSNETHHTVALKGTDAGASPPAQLTATRILLATGGWPHVPDSVPGLAEHSISSNEFFAMDTLPKSVVIYGGGYIAVELAHILKGLGCHEVTCVVRGAKVLTAFDGSIRKIVNANMEAAGIIVRNDTVIRKVDKTPSGVTVHVNKVGESADLDPDTEVIEAEMIICATGRRPRVDGLGLDTVGVDVDPTHKAVLVDEKHETSVPNIFAVGDCINRVNLTPWAIAEGRALADWLYGDRKAPLDPTSVVLPTAVFSSPEAATVGMTEEAAMEHHGREHVDVYETAFRPLKHAVTEKHKRTFMKLVVHAKTDRVLGCHAVGEDSAEMIQCLAVALSAGATKAHFDSTIALHPSSAEEWVLMRDDQKRSAE